MTRQRPLRPTHPPRQTASERTRETRGATDSREQHP